jgi:hypothetical protein
VIAGRSVNELDVDAHAARGPLHASFEDVSNVQVPADLLHVDRLAFVSEGGVARDDIRIGNTGEIGRQAFRHSVHEIFMFRVAAQIDERQHHHRQPRRRGPLGSARAWRGTDLRRRADLERIDVDRLGDVLKFSGTEVVDGHIQPPLNLPVGVLRERDGPGLGDAFETRGDIDSVPHQVAVTLFDHVAEMNPYAELDAALGRQAGVALGKAMLQLDSAAHSVDDAAKLDDGAVAGALDHPPAVH